MKKLIAKRLREKAAAIVWPVMWADSKLIGSSGAITVMVRAVVVVVVVVVVKAEQSLVALWLYAEFGGCRQAAVPLQASKQAGMPM